MHEVVSPQYKTETPELVKIMENLVWYARKCVYVTCLIFFHLGFTARQDSLILSQVNHKVRRKQEIPEKNQRTTHKQNLACLICDPS